jgi:hypothetical protein
MTELIARLIPAFHPYCNASLAAVVVWWLVRVPLRAMIVVCEEPLLPRGRSYNQRTEGVSEPLRISETQAWMELP